MQIYNGKTWISYNVNFTIRRNGSLFCCNAHFIMGINGSIIMHIGASLQIRLNHPCTAAMDGMSKIAEPIEMPFEGHTPGLLWVQRTMY